MLETPVQSLSGQFSGAYDGRRVLVTGDTGFKGSWLAIWLQQLGADVWGYAIEPPTNPSNYVESGLAARINHIHGDVRDAAAVMDAMKRAQPDVVFHLAAQPLVRYSYQHPRETFEVNTVGTCNVLDAVHALGRPCSVVIVTSDKCYENREWTLGYRESDPMGGHDPYSASKGCQELVSAAYRSSFFHTGEVRLATARAGNVIGGGDWADDRIMTDCVRTLLAGQPVPLRRPNAVRPWQHVLEPLSGYLMLGARLLDDDGEKLAKAWNFGPNAEGARTVRELVETIIDVLGDGSWVDGSSPDDPHEAGLLRLSVDQASAELGWGPTFTFEDAVGTTVEWYRRWASASDPTDAYDLCVADITRYGAMASRAGAVWAGAR